MQKRYLTFFLAALLTVMLLISCAETKPGSAESSGAVSQTESSGNAEESGGEVPIGENVEKIDRLLKHEMPESFGYRNIIRQNSYSINLEPYKNYPDDGKKLTDNDDAGLEDDDKWVGFLGRKDIEVTVDLNGLQTNLGGFSVNCRYDVRAGDNVPKKCELWISEDGVEFMRIVTSAKYPEALSASTVFTLSAYTQKGFDAAFVKLVFTDFVSQWTLIDAVRIYKIDEPVADGEYYINDPMPENVAPSFWAETESDYSKYQNLLLGLPQRVYVESTMDEDHKDPYYNTPAQAKTLTDGKRGSSAYDDPAYFHATRGLRRNIVYDLGHLSELDKAVLGIYVKTEYGIIYPDNAAVLLSENGVDWQTVAFLLSDSFPAVSTGRRDLAFDFDGAYKARFVKFSLTITAHCWLDELEVWGTKAVSSGALSVTPDEDVNFDKGYPSLDVLGGAENIILAYNYKTENVGVGRTTKERYLPYVGYYDTEDELKDFFFDSFLYLPCATDTPSGGKLYAGSETPSIMSDWLDYENDLFIENANVRALEEAVEEVKTALGQDDYQVNVFLSVFNPDLKCKNFGDVDGDGVTENLSVLSDRKKVVKWWIDRQIEKYLSFDFKNQKLIGFYWYDESLDLANAVNKETLLYALDYIHSLGYFAIWIPYHQATGYNHWESVGFDIANMQPNYAFNETKTEKVLYDNAALARLYGMGVEIETDSKALSLKEFQDRYRAYLRVGVEFGYINSIKMYYQDGGPGVFYAAYKSQNPGVRDIYDLTYKYAKKLLTLETDLPDTLHISVAPKTQYKGEMIVESNIVNGATVVLAPKYGFAAASETGKFVYTPIEGFTGTDSFVLRVTAGIFTKNITVTVDVGE